MLVLNQTNMVHIILSAFILRTYFYSAHFMPPIGRDPPCGGPQLLTSLLDFVFEQCTFAEGPSEHLFSVH